MDMNFGPLARIKMPILNRIFIDAHWLFGLENKLEGFDIAHCADTFYAFTHQCINAKKVRKVKAVVASIYENIPFNNEGIIGRKIFKSDAIKNIDRFLAVTERSKEALVLEGCDANKIIVFPSFIDTLRFVPHRNRKKNKNEIIVLFTGRMEFYKGVYEVIYSAKRLAQDVELKQFKLKFRLVGSGTERIKIEQLARKLGMSQSVSFEQTSYENMPKIYQEADIFVAPSRAIKTYQEQFCTVLLEAQSSGLPIVTTSSGGIPENVGNVALLANPGDFYSVSEQLKKFIISEKLREEYSLKARKQAVQKYDIQIGAKKLEQIYLELLDKHD